jgi:hypothetical protein
LRFDVLDIIYDGGEVSLGDADDRSLMSFGTMPLKLEMMLTIVMVVEQSTYLSKCWSALRGSEATRHSAIDHSALGGTL